MKKLIKIFKQVQKIPYKITPFNEKKIDINLKYGDCRHKTFLLKKLLKKEGYRPKITYVIFNWKNLPIPKKLTSILKKSGTLWGHKIVTLKIKNKELRLDPSWDPKLRKAKFPVTGKWKGKKNTKQITTGKLNFTSRKSVLNKKLQFNKKEAHLFANALNNYLERVRLRQ
ncbi:MAG: hypothetical protein ABH817_00185 [archaeon]